MSSRRELAVRTVFCTFFFGGDELATASLPPGRTPAFSGAAAGTSLPAGTAFEACVDSGVSAGGEAAAGASLRPKGSRAIAGLSTAFRIRTMRGWGAMADAGADVSLDWAGTSADACGRGAVPADSLGADRARIRARAAAALNRLRGCLLRRRGMRTFGDLRRCAVRMAKGDDAGYAKRARDAPEQQGDRRNAQLAA